MKIRRFRKKDRNKDRKNKQRRGLKYWAAMGAMGAFLTCGIADSQQMIFYAQQSPDGSTVSQPVVQTQSSVQRFDIGPGIFDEVIKKYQAATNIKITVTDDKILNISSPGVSGMFTKEQALKQMLTGTGISYKFNSAQTATLQVGGIDESIQVTNNTMMVSSPKFTQPLLDTPKTVSVVSAQTMQAQGDTTLREALRNVAGISLAAGEAGAQGDNLTVRGFAARNDIFIDGMRDFGSYYRDSFDLEDVEVLKGPSAVSFGRGTTGGVVNQAYKSPALASFMTGTLTGGTDATRRMTLDMNHPIEKFGTGAAFRLNVMATDANVADRNVAENRRYGIAPSLMLGLDTSTRTTLCYFHQTANDIPDYGVPWLFNQPAPVPRDTYYGYQHGNFIKTSVDIGTAKVEHDINRQVTVRNQLRFSHYERSAQITEAQIVAPVTPTTPLSSIRVNPRQIAIGSLETFLQDQLDVTARFNTGRISHTLVSGIEASRETSAPTRYNINGLSTKSLLNPEDLPFTGTPVVSSKVGTLGNSFGAYVVDTIHLGEKLDLTGGLRWDRFDVKFSQFLPTVLSFQRVDKQFTWRGAVVYKPKQNGSIYFDYGTSYNPSAEALSLSSTTTNTKPEQNRTFELGSKWDLYNAKLSLRSSIFRTEKTNAREADPNNPLQNILSGNQRVNGFEVETTAHVTSSFLVMASYALLDTRLVKSAANPTAVGARLANVPRNTANLWTTYATPWKLTLGGGAQYVGQRTASTTAPLDPATHLLKAAPGYLTFSMMAKYPLGEKLSLQMNLNNLTNKFYFDLLHPAHIVPGAGRAALFALNFRF